MTLLLYDAIRSPNCERVHIALHEKGLSYRRVTLNLQAKEQKRSEFLRLNPNGRVPVLDDNGLVLFESCVINEYLDAKYPDPPLMPNGPALVARGRLLIDYALNYLHEFYWPLRGEMRKAEGERDQEIVERNRLAILDRLEYLEAALGDKLYFLEDFGLADIGLWPRLSRIEEYGALESRKLPRLEQWMRRMSLRPSVQAVLQPAG
jgi:glutathione S-transferase